MSKKVTSFITTDIPVTNNESRLSICLRSNGFSFSITDAQNILHSFAEVELDYDQQLGLLAQDIKDIFSSLNISTFGMKEARLILPSENFAWIPQHLYDSTRDRQYLRMISELDVGLGVYHMLVPLMESYIVFSAPTTMVTAFKLAIPGIDVHCQHSVLANNDLLQRSKKNTIMLMHVRDRVGDFDVFLDGGLMLSNSFKAESHNDLLYHAIDIMKQLHLETPDLELTICGNVGRDIYALMQHYFPSVTLYTGCKVNFANPQFQTLPIYQHAMLLS